MCNHTLQTQSKMKQPLSEISLNTESISNYSSTTVVPLDATQESVSGPGSYQEALQDPDSEKWMDATQGEYDSLLLHNTWELIERGSAPPNRRIK